MLDDKFGIHWKIWLAMLTVIAAGWGVDGYQYATAPRGVPVIFDRVEPLNSPVHVGEALKVRIYREKLRDDCPVSSFRSAINQDGKVYDLPDRTWQGGPVETDYLETTYDTTSLPVGQYDLTVELAYACPEQTFTIDQPVARFRVHNGLGEAPLEVVVEQQRVMIEDLQERVEQLAPEAKE